MNEHTISPERLKELEEAEARLKNFEEKLWDHIADPENDLVSVGELTLNFFNAWQ